MEFLKSKLSARVSSAVEQLTKKDRCEALIEVELNMIRFYLEALQ